MSLTKQQLNKLEKFASLDSTSARLLSIFKDVQDFEGRVTETIKILRNEIDTNSKIRESQVREIAKKIVVKGEKGEIGPRGPEGKRGEKGDRGEPGQDGLDAQITEEVINNLALSIESQIPPMIDFHLSTTLPEITTLPKLKIDASQVENLPEGKVVERHITGTGSSGLQRIKSGNVTIRQGATEIVFGDNLTVTRTPNGVRVDAEAGGGGEGSALTAEIPTGSVNGSNTTFTVSNEPLFVVIDGLHRRAGKGYTYSGGTITVDPLSPPNYDIISYYNA